MRFIIEGLDRLRGQIDSKLIEEIGRVKATDFTRKRKMGIRELIYYNINKKGLCTNMEANNFFEKTNQDKSITAQAVFDQRMKLNPEVFTALNDEYLGCFYKGHQEEVKLYKGYVVKAIDGSDLEIPNTRKALEEYGEAKNHKGGVARAVISASYDLLNHYIIDGIIDRFRTGEIEMAMRHIQRAERITKPYESIYTMDRNYVSVGFMSYMEEEKVKFLCRLKAGSHYKEETRAMKTEDEIVILKHSGHRQERSRYKNDELYRAVKSKEYSRVRIIKYPLITGETEYLITNLEEFTYNEIVELYRLRWGIETLYHSLKQKLQIEKFTSSMPRIIEQDFLSSVLVYNITQAVRNDAEQKIDQKAYKHEMKINENMAIGFLKNDLIHVLLEQDESRRMELFDKLTSKILRFKVPIRKHRRFPIMFKADNNNSINKLKAF